MGDGATEDIGLHPDQSTADTISSNCVPIIFVPGVMGSRLAIISGRTWDPDDATAMAQWVSYFSGGKQKTRRALRPASTPATTLTDFPSGWVTEKANKAAGIRSAHDEILANARCRELARVIVGTDDEDTLVRYYSEVRNWASVAWGFYGSILMYLEAVLNPTGDDPSFPVYAFGYDWRRSNTESGLALSDFIQSTVARHSSRASEVVLVTHSMGGLVVRGGLAVNGFMAKSVRGVVHTAQPSNGAACCYRRFLTGNQPPLDSAAATPDKILANIIGTNAPAYTYNMSGLPGPLQLLPNHLYSQSIGVPWLDGQGIPQDLSGIYDLYRLPGFPGIVGMAERAEADCATKDEKTSHGVRSDLLVNLNEAQGFHRSVATTAHARTYVIFSTGLLTDHSISFEALGGTIEPLERPQTQFSRDGDDVVDEWNHIRFHRRSEGDGTVDEVSGRCPNLSVLPPTPERAATPLEHAKLFADADFRTQVLNYVRRLLTPGSP
jgi:hypothetical protein